MSLMAQIRAEHRRFIQQPTIEPYSIEKVLRHIRSLQAAAAARKPRRTPGDLRDIETQYRQWYALRFGREYEAPPAELYDGFVQLDRLTGRVVRAVGAFGHAWLEADDIAREHDIHHPCPTREAA